MTRFVCALAIASILVLLTAAPPVWPPQSLPPNVGYTWLDTDPNPPVVTLSGGSHAAEPVYLSVSKATLWAGRTSHGPVTSSIRLSNCTLASPIEQVGDYVWRFSIAPTAAAHKRRLVMSVSVPASYCEDAFGRRNKGVTIWRRAW